MTEYYPLIARAVGALETQTVDARRLLYDRARAAQSARLHKADPPFNEVRIEQERLALEEAIRKVETEAKRSERKPPESSAPQPPCAPKSAASTGIRSTVQTIAEAGAALLGFGVAIAGIVLMLFLYEGIRWASGSILPYLVSAVVLAVLVSVSVLLPLALFRATRTLAAYGLLIASFVFGATTWLLGFVATYDYLGLFWIFVGLGLGLIGVVPLGMLGGALNADWIAPTILTVGLVMTYGTRATALWLGSLVE